MISTTRKIDAPARLKRELDVVLNLHAQIDDIENALATTRRSLQETIMVSQINEFLASLEKTHEQFLTEVDTLYTSLNISERFPEVEGASVQFIKVLFLARDLKINIRKRAIGSFFEWERLDQAAGGRDQALGTWHYSYSRGNTN